MISGDSYEEAQAFIQSMNAYPESYQQEKCLVTTKHSIIQQWQQTCSVTIVQTFLGDICPRYIWQIKQIANYDVVANNPQHPMAVQQKFLLERYGGTVSARGTNSGKEIGIVEPLNELVGKTLGVHFTFQQITDLSSALGKIRGQLDRGVDVPLNIKFVGTEARHFILMMNYRARQGGYEYLIYDALGWRL